MQEAILNFNKQFLFEPEIKNSKNLARKKSFVSIGMGGSNLAPKLLKSWKPDLDILVHSDYGLPEGELKNKTIIISSYSGNTEESIDAFEIGKKHNLSMVVISTGGKLLDLAIKNKIPYIQMPNAGIQPRMALGFSIKAFLKIIGEEELKNISKLATTLNPSDYEEEGKKLAKSFKNHIPVVYSSTRNLSIAYNWKIKFNETGKIPAFYNVFPELNHNEMTGFDLKDATRELSQKFYFILFKDKDDDPRIQKRMGVLENLYKNRGLSIQTIEIKGENIWHKIFGALILADWAAYHTALEYGLEAEQVPMVEEFKKLILD
ncbi:hypothetical protein HYZ82_01590 [Candidatus Nomurabacteria bacterium]|nr:hypothetical protein [Candidatus Nomurabacteria bacterium]